MRNNSENVLFPYLYYLFQKLRNQYYLETQTEIVLLETFRTQHRQANLFKQTPQVSKAPPGYSWHNYGLAFDALFDNDPCKKGRQEPYIGNWELLGKLGKKLGLEWGGGWALGDKGHFQFTAGMTIKEAIQLSKSPDGVLAIWTEIDQRLAKMKS